MAGQAQSILIAVLLFIFGEKSIAVAKLSLHAHDAFLKGRPPREGAEFEIAMLGLALGTAIAVLLARLGRNRDAKGDLTIFIGVVTASIAGLLNIGEAALDSDANFGVYPQQALFFYFLWLLLVILPSFTEVMRGNVVEIKVLSRVLSALAIGAVLGFAVQILSGLVIKELIQAPGANSLNDGLRHFGMRPVAVTALGAVFIAAALTSFDGRSWWWIALYGLTATAAGFAYGALLHSGQPAAGVSQLFLNSGFAMLCAAVFAPALIFGRKLLNGDATSLPLALAVWFVACAGASFLGLGQALGHPTDYNIKLSLMQGVAGTLIPVSLWLSALVSRRDARQAAPTDPS